MLADSQLVAQDEDLQLFRATRRPSNHTSANRFRATRYKNDQYDLDLVELVRLFQSKCARLAIHRAVRSGGYGPLSQSLKPEPPVG
jgi:hypothetical protein